MAVTPPQCAQCPTPLAAKTLAERLGIKGAVRLRVLVAATGAVTKVDFVSGPSALRDAVVKTVAKWKYRPATQGGAPLEATVLVDLQF